MTSPSKAAANAANAQLSTGPRTLEGKTISSQNAIKHGLTARQVVVREDEIEKFNDLRDFLLAEIDPQGALEIETFNILLHASWNIERFCNLEADLMADGLDPLLDDSKAKTLDRIHRYHRDALRNYHRAMNQLRTLQTNRAVRRASIDEEDAKKLPVLCTIKQLPNRSRLQVEEEAVVEAFERFQEAHRDGIISVLGIPVQNEPTATPSGAAFRPQGASAPQGQHG